MTVESNDTVERYLISGTGPYAYSFRIFSESDLVVHADTGEIDPTLLSLTTHYTVDGVDDANGGTVTLTSEAAALYASDFIDIRSSINETQPTSIRNLGRFLPEIHEDALDRLSRQIQDISRRVDRKFGYPDNTTLAGEMTLRSAWAERWLYVNANGEIEPATAISPQALTQSIIGALLFPITPQEAAAGCTAANTNRIVSVSNAFRYGVTGDGVTNDQAAFQRCFLANDRLTVFVPRGTYVIGASLAVYNQNITSDSKEYVTFKPSGNFECFVNSGNEFITGSIRRCTIMYNSGVQPTSSVGNDRKIGVYWTPVNGRSPNFFELEDIEVRGAWWAHYDDSGSYACNVSRFFMRDSQNGFYKANGTTFTLNQVIGLNCNKGFLLNNNDDFVLNACANDGAVITAGGCANEFISCVSFSIVGFDSESNTVGGDSSTLFSFLDCAGTFMGASGHVNAFSEDAGFTSLIKCDDSNMLISGHRARRSSGLTELTMAGNGTYYQVLAVNDSKITVIGSEFFNPTTVSGSPIYRSFHATGTSHIQVLGTQYDGTLGSNAYELKTEIGEFTATLTGINSVQTGTLRWRLNNRSVILQIPAISGSSDTTAATLTPALPAGIRPARTQRIPIFVTDNTTTAMGVLEVGTDGSLTLYPSPNGGNFTGSGTKGVPVCVAHCSLD